MLIKLFIISAFFFVVYNLGHSLYFLLHDTGHSNRSAKALTWRISLSLLLFVFLIAAYFLGWIKPHGMV